MSLLQCANQLTIDPAVEIQTLLNRSIIDVAARHMVAARVDSRLQPVQEGNFC